MFPTGKVGFALVALRTAAAATLIVDGLGHSNLIESSLLLSAFGLVALCLCVGFLTPYCAACSALVELAALVIGNRPDAFHLVLSMAEACILAILGPGGYSLDARLFGRKVLQISPRR